MNARQLFEDDDEDLRDFVSTAYENQQFWVLTLSTSMGVSSGIFTDEEKALQALADYCRSNWREVADSTDLDAPPPSNTFCIDAYFGATEDGNYDLQQLRLNVFQ